MTAPGPARAPGSAHGPRPAGGARRLLLALLALAASVGALVFLLKDVSLRELALAMARQPTRQILATLVLTAASFACLACHDLVGARVAARGRVRPRIALMAGATGSAIANTVGFHALSGTAVRARIYLAAGLTAAEVARIASLSWLSLGAGNAAMFAVAEVAQASATAHPMRHLGIGAALLLALSTLLAWFGRARRELVVFGHRFPMPSARIAFVQVMIGALESATAIGALYVLLPPDLAPPFSLFAAGCIVAVLLGAAAHTPGGIGVFEASMTALLGGRGRADLVAALLLYRLIYNLLPFALAVVALALHAGSGTVRWRR